MEHTDDQIHNDVLDVLDWDNFIDSSQISVNVKNGTIFLAGTVPRYADILAAHLAAGTVKGVVDVQGKNYGFAARTVGTADRFGTAVPG